MPTCHGEDTNKQPNVAAGQNNILTVDVASPEAALPRGDEPDDKDDEVEDDYGDHPRYAHCHCMRCRLAVPGYNFRQYN